ncbi:MAG: PorV/PorQ family protein, partial [bacterium]
AQGSHPNDNLEKFQVGAEYWFSNMFAIRSGYRFGAWDAEKFNVGAGVKLPIGNVITKIDYAFSDMQELKSTHKFTLGLEF